MNKTQLKGPWTQFWDMHSGGGLKEKWHYIYIQAPKKEAITIFYNRFGHNPNRVTCTCCGEDYAIDESASLDLVTKYQRKRTTIDNYCKQKDVLIIFAGQIGDEERKGEVPEQGYVWKN